MRDWIHGVRAASPPKETREALEAEPLYEAERLRIIYQLITNPTEEGGAGITPKEGEWENVESVFALHDHEYNKDWIKKWSTSYFLQAEDLDDIRNRLGEKVCLDHGHFVFKLIKSGGLLLCLHSIVLYLLNISRSIRFPSMDVPGTLLAHIRHRECGLVYRVHGMVETSGN